MSALESEENPPNMHTRGNAHLTQQVQKIEGASYKHLYISHLDIFFRKHLPHTAIIRGHRNENNSHALALATRAPKHNEVNEDMTQMECYK